MTIVIFVILVLLTALCILIGIYIFDLAINKITSTKYFSENLRIFTPNETKEQIEEKIKEKLIMN